MYYPLNIPEFNIYDLSYSLDRYIITRPFGRCCPTHLCLTNLNIKINNQNFVLIRDDRTEIYICIQPYKDIVDITINGVIYKNLKVSLYPDLKNEIIITTMCKKEDSYIIQWIEYNLTIGFTKVIIYDNKESKKTRYQSKEKKSNLKELLKDYIEAGTVVLINWKYPKNNCINGQTTQQNHALYNFNNAKYIAFFDIDEYINITNYNSNIEIILDKILGDDFSACRICCKFFQNPEALSEIKYDFLKINTYLIGGTAGCKLGKIGEIDYGAKIIVKPNHVSLVRVHKMNLKEKKKLLTIKSNNFNKLYFNHYHFLNKLGRGKHKSALIDSSLNKYFSILSPKNI